MEQEPQKELEVLWSAQQVAKYLGMNVITIYRWIGEKRMFNPEKIIRISRRVRIPRSEVERIAGTIRDKITNTN